MNALPTPPFDDVPEIFNEKTYPFHDPKNPDTLPVVDELNGRIIRHSDRVLESLAAEAKQKEIPAAEQATEPAELTEPAQPAGEASGEEAEQIEPAYLTAALNMAARGVPVFFIPAGEKGANLPGWRELCTTDPEKIRAMAAENPTWTNYACVGKAIVNVPLPFDDDAGIVNEYEKLNGELPATLKAQSCNGAFHYYFTHSAKSVEYCERTGKDRIQEDKPNGEKGELWSLRMNNSYVIGPGSVVARKDGTPGKYQIVRESLMAEIPDKFFDYLLGRYEAAQIKEKQAAAANPDEPIVEGGRNNKLASIAGKLRDTGSNYDEILARLLRENEERCQPPLPDSEVQTIAESVSKYPAGDVFPVLFDGKVSTAIMPAQAPVPEFKSIMYADAPKIIMTEEEIEKEMEKEFPVLLLETPVGPVWNDDILYGPAGEVIRWAMKYNESHPAGMLLDLLVSLGNIMGPKPHFMINATAHHTNEFLARIGKTSDSRKGTGRDEIDALLQLIEPIWFRNRVQSGFGSSESIIGEIKDSTTQSVFNARKHDFESKNVPGVEDKRLCIREPEIAGVFVLASKPGSLADVVIRNAWDSKPLKNTVKGKDRNGFSLSASCQEPHISISGDTTVGELLRELPAGADSNGFGNRFLYAFVYKTKHCSNGGPKINWSQKVEDFKRIIEHARNRGYVPLSDAARKAWNRMYIKLEENKLPGQAGMMTARAAAHVRRLALIYTLIDRSEYTETVHLHAALKLWLYCEDTVRMIFGKFTKEQLELLEFIERRGTVDLPTIREELYQKHKLADWIKQQVNRLVQLGHVSLTGKEVKFLRK